MNKKLKMRLESDVRFGSYWIQQNPYSGATVTIPTWLTSGTSKSLTDGHGIEETYEVMYNPNPDPRYMAVLGFGFYNRAIHATDAIILTQQKHPNYYNQGETTITSEVTVGPQRDPKTVGLLTSGGRIFIRSYAIINGDSSKHSVNSDYFKISAGTTTMEITQVGQAVEKSEYIEWTYNVGENTEFSAKSCTFLVIFDNKNGSTWTDSVRVSQAQRLHTYTNAVIELNSTSVEYTGGTISFNGYYTRDGIKIGLTDITVSSTPVGVVEDYDYNSTTFQGWVKFGANSSYSIRTAIISGDIQLEDRTPKSKVTSDIITQEAKPNDKYVFELVNEEGWVKSSSSGLYSYTIHEPCSAHTVTFGVNSTNNGSPNYYQIDIVTGSSFCHLTSDASTLSDTFTINLDDNYNDNDRTAIIKLTQTTHEGVSMTPIQITIIQLDSASSLIYKNTSDYTAFTHAMFTVGMDFMTGEYIDLLANVYNSTNQYRAVGEDAEKYFGVTNKKGDTDKQILLWGGDNIEIAGNERIVCTPSDFVTEMESKNTDMIIGISGKTTSFTQSGSKTVISNGIISITATFCTGDNLFKVTNRPTNINEQVFSLGADNKSITSRYLTSQINGDSYCKICELIRYRTDGRWYLRQDKSNTPTYALANSKISIDDAVETASTSANCYFYNEEGTYIGNYMSSAKYYGYARAVSSQPCNIKVLPSANRILFTETSLVAPLSTYHFDYDRTLFRIVGIGFYNSNITRDFTKVPVSELESYYSEANKTSTNSYWYYRGYTSHYQTHIYFIIHTVNDLAESDEEEEEETTKTIEKAIYLYSISASSPTAAKYLPYSGWSGTIKDAVTQKETNFTINYSSTRSYVRTMTWEDISNGSTTNDMYLTSINFYGSCDQSQGLEGNFYPVGIQWISNENDAFDSKYVLSENYIPNTPIKYASTTGTIRWVINAPRLIHDTPVTDSEWVYLKMENIPSFLTYKPFQIGFHVYKANKIDTSDVQNYNNLPSGDGIQEYKTVTSSTYSAGSTNTSFISALLPTTTEYSATFGIIIAAQIIYNDGEISCTVYHSNTLQLYKQSGCYVTWDASIASNTSNRKTSGVGGMIFITNGAGTATTGMTSTNIYS